MEGIFVLVILLGAILTATNLRNAHGYTRALQSHGLIRRGVLRWHQYRILRRASVITVAIFVLVFSVIDPASVHDTDKLFLLLLTVALVYSQLYEDWAHSQCRQAALLNREP